MFGALESLTAASLRLTPTEWDAVGTYHGIEGVEAATRDAFEAWDWFWQEAEQFIEVGDDVVVLTYQHGRLKGTEREVESKAGELWTFRDGKVVRHKSFDSPAEALEAAGLRKGSSRLSLTAETGLASLRMSTRLNAPANSIWDRLRAAYAIHQRLGEQLNVTPSDSSASPRARR